MSRRFSRVESSGDLLGFLDRGHSANRENRWTFEVAWEAANKVSILLNVKTVCTARDNLVLIVRVELCRMLLSSS